MEDDEAIQATWATLYAAFDDAVIDMLIFRDGDRVGADGKQEIVANGAYNCDNIRATASLARQQASFSADPKVLALKFSDGWITKFLKRHDMHRRRVTCSIPDYPSVDPVCAVMALIQETI